MVGVFLSVFGSFAALMYLSITTFSERAGRSGMPFFRIQQGDWRIGDTRKPNKPSHNPITHPTDVSKLLLKLNQKHAVGKAVLTYRGLDGGSNIRLDVLVPELDSQYTYLHKINIDRARKGFQVGGEHLKLISAGRSKIRLARQVPQQ